jgi:hypothetical protein
MTHSFESHARMLDVYEKSYTFVLKKGLLMILYDISYSIYNLAVISLILYDNSYRLLS